MGEASVVLGVGRVSLEGVAFEKAAPLQEELERCSEGQ